MGGFSIWHWFTVLLIVVGYLVPLWRIVGKAGFHGAVSTCTRATRECSDAVDLCIRTLAC
jgi:hypothetical protein